ncbi:hypothetical protein CIG19_10310 [Enterobacterales bacterium CwR94]|nr:hypothetical protein CIG19_10310 [Enterobacterales bacterium CwR94]
MLNKIMFTLVAAVSVASFQASAATEIPLMETDKHTHVGDVSVSGNAFSYEDAAVLIKQEAEKKGADHFYVSRFAMSSRGFGANVVLYDDKITDTAPE